jgi:hypothetical protein
VINYFLVFFFKEFDFRRMSTEETVVPVAPVPLAPPLTDKQACRIARAYLRPKLEEITSVLRAEDFPDVDKLPERAVLITPGAPCIMPECTFVPSTLKEAAKHYRSTPHDLAAFYGDNTMDERVAIGITSWPLKMKEWKIASVEDQSILGTDFYFTLSHLM